MPGISMTISAHPPSNSPKSHHPLKQSQKDSLLFPTSPQDTTISPSTPHQNHIFASDGEDHIFNGKFYLSVSTLHHGYFKHGYHHISTIGRKQEQPLAPSFDNISTTSLQPTKIRPKQKKTGSPCSNFSALTASKHTLLKQLRFRQQSNILDIKSTYRKEQLDYHKVASLRSKES